MNAQAEPMMVACPDCGARESLSPDRWRCDCGGAWEFAERPTFDPARIASSDFSLWRYRDVLGVPFDNPPARLNAGMTPLVPLAMRGREALLKLEYVAPTSSFKDRGTEVMINILAHQGVRHVVEDSSGNAGASVAAYAARAGMQADIFVPAYASQAKQAQIAVYGARVRPIPGVRDDARRAAWEAAAEEYTMASHAYHPGFLLGQQTLAWELWEQLGGQAPDWYVVPLGQGVHLLGVWLGFRELQAAGHIARLPRMVGVQAAALAPVCQAFEAGREDVPAVEPRGRSVAEGVAIARPVRGRRLLQALRETRGLCIAVDDDAALRAQENLAHRGIYVEPTSAIAFAALNTVLDHAAPEETVIVPLTGSGLKGSPRG